MQIEHLLKDPQKLLETDWKALDELKKKYPYSNLISFLLARKHYLENKDLENDIIKSAILQNQNPGSTLSYVINGSHQDIIPLQHRSTEKKQKAKEINDKSEAKTKNISIEEKKVTKIRAPEKFIKSDFTQWLIEQNENLVKEKSIKKSSIQGKFTKPAENEPQLKNEILSESLAQLYAMQGLKEEAIDMYEKLSLKNPKKSTYFAEIIEQLKKE